MENVEWEQGLVKFVVTDHRGNESKQEQMCWHRGKFIARMTADALKSQMNADETGRFKFRLQ